MPWISKDVHVVLETELALDIFKRADQWDVDSGGRFDRRGASIIIWSASFTGDWKTAEPQGQADFRWRTPGDGQATLSQIGWDPAEGGSEDIVWEALAVLAGRSLRPG